MAYELAASTWGAEELEAIRRTIDLGRFTMGEQVAAFEQQFAAYFGMRYGVMVNSGSSANLVAVAALFFKKDRPLQRGDEVIVPAISWSTTYHPLQQYGLRLRFVDVELETLNLDVRKLERALTPRTRAIVAVSILGNPAALDVIEKFAAEHGLYLLEDNCESMDAELGGRKTGTFGHLNTFSFFFSHHISTMEGGMVLTNDLELHHLLRSLRAHGWTRDLPSESPLYERGDDDHFEAYRFILPGYNVRPIELAGAIGREQLKKLPAMTAQRRANLALFRKLFAGDRRFILQRENGKSSCFSFTLILNPACNLDRKRIFSALREAGIGFRMITGGCFLRHDAIRYFDYDVVDGATPNADLAHDRGFFVGNGPYDLVNEITRLREVLDRAAGFLTNMNNSYSILITGGAGYIGSTLAPALLAAGHRVTVLDNFLFGQAPLNQLCADPTFNVVRGDARDPDILKPLLRGTDIVIPLAALVGAPICNNDKIGAETINRDAVKTLIGLASREQRILMPITNSGYGIGETGKLCTEETPLRPITLYGRTKVEAEKAVLDRGNSISFRLATVFGMSPRMRIDLLVNDFVYRAVNDRAVVLFEAHFKRNYIHVRDVARVFLHGIQHFDGMRDQPYNVGLSDANLSKAELCERIQKQISKFVYLEAAVGEDPDKRDYIVSNEKVERTGYRPEYSLDQGIGELIKGYRMLRNTVHGNA